VKQEKHIHTQISQLYRNVLQQQCNLEHKVLKNVLALPLTLQMLQLIT